MNNNEAGIKNNRTSIAGIFTKNGFYFVFAIVVIIFSLTTKTFLTGFNITQLLLNNCGLLIICSGLMFVMLMGMLDLSVGSVAFVTAACSVTMMEAGMSAPLAILISFVIGAGIGVLNGIFIAKLHMNHMVTTLAMMMALRGLALIITNGRQVFFSKAVKSVGMYSLFGFLPFIVIISIVVLIIGYIVVAKTRFGRNVIAIGCNPTAAEDIGIKVDKIKIFAYAISGLCSAIGGFALMINLGAVQPYMGQGLEFITVTAIVVGGTSMFGGRGSHIGTLFGVLLLGIIANGLGLYGANPYIYPFVRGFIIFIAMFADAMKNH